MTAPTTARIYQGTPRNLAFLARRLQAGDLVAVPTETVYGLAANALDPHACRSVFTAKGRPTADPLIVHVHSLEQLATLANVNEAARMLAKKFWPGPLTLILPKKPSVPDIVSSGLPSVAVRMPAHPLFRRLLRLTDLPLAAPSANPFGYVSPTTAEHVRTGLGRKIRHILDGGPCEIGLESTIVDVRNPRRPRLLRPGAITREQIERTLQCRVVVGATVRPQRSGPARISAQIAPGQLARHYSPRTPVVLHRKIDNAEPARGSPREAWVFLAKPKTLSGPNIFWLDPKGRLGGAAHRLFDVLRQVDGRKFSRLHIELAPGDGLAVAINDRLSRAAARRTKPRRGTADPR